LERAVLRDWSPAALGEAGDAEGFFRRGGFICLADSILVQRIPTTA